MKENLSAELGSTSVVAKVSPRLNCQRWWTILDAEAKGIAIMMAHNSWPTGIALSFEPVVTGVKKTTLKPCRRSPVITSVSNFFKRQVRKFMFLYYSQKLQWLFDYPDTNFDCFLYKMQLTFSRFSSCSKWSNYPANIQTN